MMGKIPGIAAVQVIPGERIPQMRHMHPYLMRPSRFQPERKQGIPVTVPERYKVGDRRLSVCPDTPPDDRAVLPADGRIDRAAFGEDAADQRQIGFPGAALELLCGVGRLGSQTNAAGVPVQPVHRAKRQLRELCGKHIPQGVAVMPLRGMHRHMRRLVVNDVAARLVQHRYRNRRRLKCRGVFPVGENDLVSVSYRVNGADGRSVAADAAGDSLEPYQHPVRNALVPPEKLFQGHRVGTVHSKMQFCQKKHVLSYKIMQRRER